MRKPDRNTETHWVIWESANSHHRVTQAACGAFVGPEAEALHGATPTCQTCARLQADDAAALDRLLQPDDPNDRGFFDLAVGLARSQGGRR
jgi:hypothetical protein